MKTLFEVREETKNHRIQEFDKWKLVISKYIEAEISKSISKGLYSLLFNVRDIYHRESKLKELLDESLYEEVLQHVIWGYINGGYLACKQRSHMTLRQDYLKLSWPESDVI